MSDKDLAAYIELLGSKTLDAEFERMVDAEKRGMIYLAERRVEEQNLRVECEGASEACALLHPAADLRRIVVLVTR